MNWKEILRIEQGADITKMEAPIPKTIGEGFSFDLDGRRYTTTGDYPPSKNKEHRRLITFNITSFVGLCAEAVHYYCSVTSSIYNISGNYTVMGYLNGIEIPNENKSFKAEIVRPITKKELNSERWEYLLGDTNAKVNAFESIEELDKYIDEVKKIFPKEQWIVVIERNY